MKTMSLLLSVLITCSLWACDDGKTRTDAGVPDADADADADAGVDADADADVVEPLTDNTLVVSTGIYRSGGLTNLNVINAIAGEGERCRVDTVGECHVIDCAEVNPGDPLPSTVDLGAVSLMRGEETLLVNAPYGDHIYPATYVQEALWTPGEELTVVTAGGDMPAFTWEFEGPAPVTLLAPLESGTLPVGQPLHVTWEPAEGTVAINLSQSFGMLLLTSRRVLCEVDAALGEYDVPVAVMSTFEPGELAFNAGGGLSEGRTVGGYNVYLHAANSATISLTLE